MGVECGGVRGPLPLDLHLLWEPIIMSYQNPQKESSLF